MSAENDSERVFIVRPAADGKRWHVMEPGDARPQEFDSKDAAIEAGKTLAQGHGPSKLQIQSSTGDVESSTAYGKDPLVTQLEKFGF